MLGWARGLVLVAAAALLASADLRTCAAGRLAPAGEEAPPGATRAGVLASLPCREAQAWLLGGRTALFFCATDTTASDEEVDAVEEARRALVRAGRVPWYDRQHDTLRRLAVEPAPPPARAAAPQTLPKGRPAARAHPWLGAMLQGLGLGVLAVVLGLISVALVASFLRQEQQETTVRKVIASRRDADRVASLPLALDAAPAELLAQARRLAAEGQFSEAIVYLFSYELLLLDQQQVLRLAPGKTNRQYLRETRDRPALAAILARTVQAFEAAFFGHKTIAAPTFAACWQDLEAFHAELAQLHPAAV